MKQQKFDSKGLAMVAKTTFYSCYYIQHHTGGKLRLHRKALKSWELPEVLLIFPNGMKESLFYKWKTVIDKDLRPKYLFILTAKMVKPWTSLSEKWGFNGVDEIYSRLDI